MDPDDSSCAGPSSNRGNDYLQRHFPFQADYEHGMNTPKRRRLEDSQAPTPAPAQFQSYFEDTPSLQASVQTPMKPEAPKFTPFLLLPHHEPIPQNMSRVDALICQNVEIFQSYAEEGPQSAQLGLRCIHCARAMQRHVDSCIIFPSSVETIENSVRIIKERHFPSCQNLPMEAREIFDKFHNSERGSSHDTFSLSQFLQNLCRTTNIINRQPLQTGIVWDDMSYEPVMFPHSDSTSTSYAKSDVPAHKPSPLFPEPANNPISPSIPYSPVAQKPLQHQQQRQIPSQQYQDNAFYENTDVSPFIQTAPNIWECRNCLNLPIGHRGKRYAWYAPTPPNKAFMEDHLQTCAGGRQLQQQHHHQQQQQQHQHQQQQQQQTQRAFHPQNQQNAYASQQQQQNYAFQNQPYPTSSTFNPAHQFNRQYQNPMQMHMKAPFQPQQRQFAPASFKQQYRAQQEQMSHPYHNSYHHPSWRPSFPQAGFSSSNSQMMQTHSTALGHFNTPPKDSSVYQQGHFNQESSHAKDDFENAIGFLNKMEEINRGGEADPLVEETDRILITDYFYFVMKQLRMCHFKEEDRATRGGKRDSIEIGYGGLECFHCRRTPSARKFFWSNVDRLSNSFSEIPGHVLKCKACPETTKKALLEVKKQHAAQMTAKSRGSQKTFLRRVWRRMHVGDVSLDASDNEHPDSADLLPVDSIVTLGSDSPDTRNIRENLPQVATIGGMSCEVAAKALLQGTREPPILLAIDQDKEWGLSDLDCFVRKNVEIFCATAEEAQFYSREHGEIIFTGQVGIRCVNCSSTQVGYTSFPAALDDLFSGVRAFKSKHLCKCPNLTQEDRDKFEKLAEKSSSSFGSLVRQYYLKAAESLGLRDYPKGGIKATGQGGFKEF